MPWKRSYADVRREASADRWLRTRKGTACLRIAGVEMWVFRDREERCWRWSVNIEDQTFDSDQSFGTAKEAMASVVEQLHSLASNFLQTKEG
jgi:hypothetical protein